MLSTAYNLSVPSELNLKCADECEKETSRRCCTDTDKCWSRETGIAVEGKFDSEKYNPLFSESRDYKFISDEWKAVVVKS